MQCLFNTEKLVKEILFNIDINKLNTISTKTKGYLTLSFFELLYEVFIVKKNIVTAKSIKDQLAFMDDIFQGDN